MCFSLEFVPRRVKPIDKKRIHVCACAKSVFKMMRKVFANVARMSCAGFTGLSYAEGTKPSKSNRRLQRNGIEYRTIGA